MELRSILGDRIKGYNMRVIIAEEIVEGLNCYLGAVFKEECLF